MAVFVSFSDESTGKNQRDTFVWAGWLGPEEDWSRFFTPAWNERVLAGPPRIPYLHMTDIRNQKWRDSHGIASIDAENRIDHGCVVLDQLANLHPLRVVIDTDYFRDEFREIRVTPDRRKQFASTMYGPDYLAFLAYAWTTLKYLAEYPTVCGLRYSACQNFAGILTETPCFHSYPACKEFAWFVARLAHRMLGH
jgi:hypothetical protein